MQAPAAHFSHKVIVIGASTGGYEAVRQVLQGLPAGFAASVLIAVHPREQSQHAGDLEWARLSPLPIAYARQGSAILAGHVYVAPAYRHLEIDNDLRLELSDPVRGLRPIPWADRLFFSAAQAFGQRTIGVILSGNDTDGSKGMKAIHDAGGIGIVQEPSDAADPSMPLSSLRIDHPAYCLPLREIAEVLSTLASE